MPPEICFENVSENNDIKNVMKKRYSCKYDGCVKQFDSKVRLNGHVAQIHTKLLPFSCPEEGCNEVFAMQIYLNRHLKRHQNVITKKCRKQFQCTECNEKFDRKWMLRSHLHHIHGESPTHRCVVCKKVFYIKYKLDKHFRKVHEKPIRQCNFIGCDFTTDKWSVYRKHIAEHNSHKKCQFCDKVFVTTSNCRTHEREIHFDQFNHNPDDNDSITTQVHPKLFRCEYDNCTKSYFRKSNLNQHVKSCHQEPKLKCEICDKMFALKHVLNHHIKNVHSKSESSEKKAKKTTKNTTILENDECLSSVDKQKLKIVQKFTSKKEIKKYLGDNEHDDDDEDSENNNKDGEFNEQKTGTIEKDQFTVLCAIAQSSLV